MADRAILILSRIFAAMGDAFDRSYLRWARDHLSTHNPMHPDLPGIVLRLNELERAR